MDENTQKPSYIHIEFDQYGSTNFTALDISNVHPLQLLAVSSYLEFEAKYQLNYAKTVALQKEENRKLTVPDKPKILRTDMT